MTDPDSHWSPRGFLHWNSSLVFKELFEEEAQSQVSGIFLHCHCHVTVENEDNLTLLRVRLGNSTAHKWWLLLHLAIFTKIFFLQRLEINIYISPKEFQRLSKLSSPPCTHTDVTLLWSFHLYIIWEYFPLKKYWNSIFCMWCTGWNIYIYLSIYIYMCVYIYTHTHIVCILSILVITYPHIV